MSIRVEVVYALTHQQERVLLDLPSDSTVLDAIEASGLLLRQPVQIDSVGFGVWGRVANQETRLRDRDRVEIYRRLIADPKEARRERAANARK